MPFYKSASSLRSEGSDLDMDSLAENELARLQRQFRLLEVGRHAYTLKSRETIRRQMLEVKRLEKEKEQLLRRQAVAESRVNQQRGKDQACSLRALLGCRDDVEQQIMEEKKRLAVLDREMQSWEKRLAVQKKEVGSGYLIQQQKAHLLKRTRTMEDQLDRATTQFSSQLAVNSQLREDLETLQVARDRFEQVYKNLEKELLTIRGNIGAVVITSSAAYDARDEAQNRLTQLQDKMKKDLRQYETELRELNRVLDHDRLVEEFIAIKLQERKFTDDALKAKEKREEERKRQSSDEDFIDNYQLASERLLHLTGMNSLDEAVEKFITEEELNFAQFNFVNEQNNQLEQTREQIAELNHEIDVIQTKENRAEAEVQLQLQATEMQQEGVVNEAKQCELLLKAQIKIWEMFKSEIESLFAKLNCDPSVLEKLLGGSAAARDEKIAVYMSSIEQRINQLLVMYSLVIAEEEDKPFDTLETLQLILGQKSEFPSFRLNVRPPTAGPGHEGIVEDDQRPWTHTELKEKVLKEILSKADAVSQKKSIAHVVSSARFRTSGYKRTQHAS